MVKLLIGALVSLTAANAVADNIFIYEDEGQKTSNVVAGNMNIYKDKSGQVLLTNINPNGNFDKFTKKVKVTYYVDKNKGSESNQKQKVLKEQNVSHGTSIVSKTDSSAYANSAYLALR